MADKELKIKITGDTTNVIPKIKELTKEIETITPSAAKVTEAFNTLRIKSVAEMEEIVQSAKKAYEEIRMSGTATPQDIANAHKAMTDVIEQNGQKQVSLTGRLAAGWNKVKAAWIEIGITVAAANFLKNWVVESVAGEEAANKLRIQIENLGIAYKDVEASIDAATEASARYAIVQKGEVQEVLQQLVFTTGDLNASLKNLNLVYDLAYLKGISVASSAEIVAKAMVGEADLLSRVFLEFRNLNEKLGENRTKAQEAAVAMAFLNEKVKGSQEQISSHARILKEATNGWKSFKSEVGNVLLIAFDKTKTTMEAISDLIEKHSGSWSEGIKIGLGFVAPLFNIFEMMKPKTEEVSTAIEETTDVSGQLQEEIIQLTILIEEQGKKAELSGEQIIKITEKVIEAHKQESEAIGQTALEKQNATKKISDLITTEINLSRKQTEDQKVNLEKRKQGLEEAYAEGIRLAEQSASRQNRIETEVLNVKLQNYQKAATNLSNTLNQGLASYNEYKNEVIRLEAEIKAERENAAKKETELSRKFMSENERNWDIVNAAVKNLSDAKQAADEKDFVLAAELYRKSREEFTTLADETESKNKKFSKSVFAIFETAVDGMKQANEGLNQSLIEQQKIAISNAIAQKKENTNTIKQIDEITAKVEALIREQKAIELRLTVEGYEEAVAKKAELEKPTSSTHTIYTQTVEGRSTGGRIIKAATGRYFPGFGGGDKIPILGEAGEYMARKEAVKYWGVDFFEALNQMNVSRAMNALGARKFASGGSIEKHNNKVSSGISGSSGDKVNVDLNLGGEKFPMTAKKEVANDFLEKIKRTNILRGRHTSPY